MRKTAFVLALSTLAAMGMTSCGNTEKPNASKTQDIATDLPDTGILGPVYRYWVQEGVLFRGQCEGREIIVASNCRGNIAAMDYKSFKTDLDGGLTNSAVELFRELMEINLAITSVEKSIEATTESISVEQKRLGASTAELDATLTELHKVRTFIHEYKVQLNRIDLQLRILFDAELHAQGAEMAAQLDSLRVQLTAICGQIPGIVAKIVEIKGNIETLNAQLDSLSVRLTNLQTDHDRVMADFERTCQELAIYRETLDKLTSGIIYRVMADNTRWQAERRFIKRFDRIFTAAQQTQR